MLKAHPFICLFFTALLVVVLITPLVRKLAWKVGAVDYPNKRRINRKPIPRMRAHCFIVTYGSRSTLFWLAARTHTISWHAG